MTSKYKRMTANEEVVNLSIAQALYKLDKILAQAHFSMPDSAGRIPPPHPTAAQVSASASRQAPPFLPRQRSQKREQQPFALETS